MTKQINEFKENISLDSKPEDVLNKFKELSAEVYCWWYENYDWINELERDKIIAKAYYLFRKNGNKIIRKKSYSADIENLSMDELKQLAIKKGLI